MTRIAQLAVLTAAWVLASQPAPAQQADKESRAAVPGSATDAGRGDNWAKWLDMPQVPSQFDWRPAESGFTKHGTALRNPRAPARDDEPTESADRFMFGSNYLGIQTQKGLQDPFRQRKDCANDDECAEYSAFPRSEGQAKKNFKNFKQPYIGLSVTRPIQ